MKKSGGMNRRDLLKNAAGVAMAPMVVPASALGRQGNVPPSDRIALGVIGVGERGRFDLPRFLAQKDARVVAVCDVNSNARDAALTMVNKQYGDKGCREYRDFREILASKDIDAVQITTPVHWHVPMVVAAARAGKDIFCEKPMGLAIAWDQAARAAVHRYGTVFQFGTQQRTQRVFEYAVQLVLAGALGELKEVRTWVPDSEWRGRASAPAKPAPVPDNLDWDMWLGPAPYSPYWPGKERSWSGSSDCSPGALGGWGVHNLDICRWGLSNRAARTVEVRGTAGYPRDGERDNPIGWDMTYQYDHGVPIHYTSLGRMPEEWRRRYQWQSDHGVAFEGSDGWVHVNRLRISAEPRSLLRDLGAARDVRANDSVYRLVRNFLDCVKSRHTPAAGIDEGMQSDMSAIIGDMALLLGTPLLWDIQQERFLNNEKANQLRNRAMRSPWQV